MAFSFGTTTAAPAAASGFSFGAAAGAPPASSGFSFGSTAPAPSAPPTGGFSFGAAPTTSGFSFGTTPTTSGFSFGAKPAATPATGFSLSSGNASLANPFGSSSATPATSGFNCGASTTPATITGGFGFNPAEPAAPSLPPGPPITLETVFEELPEDVKKNITQFHKFLKEQDQSDAFLKTVSPRLIEVLRENMIRLEQEVLARHNRQNSQTAAVHHMRQDVRQLLHQVDAATLTRRNLDPSSVPNLYHIMRRVEMPSPYYWDLLKHFEQKMAAIKAQIEDIEAQLKPLYDERDGAENRMEMPAPMQLQHILLAQNTALVQAAAQVAEVHEKAEEVRQLFLATMMKDLARRGEKNPAAFQNPFDKRKKSSEADKRQAIDKIRFRTSVAPTIVTPQPTTAFAPPSTFGFGTPAATSSTPAASGFSFGTSSAPAKTVSFNLTSTTATSVAPPATTTSVTAAPLAAGSTVGGFSVPSVATNSFGVTTLSFLPSATDTTAKTSVGAKRAGGRMQKKR
ncbi:hypothetical protein PsorP6_010623 [Peronosclerospora sorghi]|uniref:Uncharacterized protein n=1 Tax=Peronosclerospora sorghi TaxID=230839 RepID=A0ACC0VUS7_9STRA|nr:hypothetical protein PsorP6_010623 [Peronosclerospora sorghi]